ncbi:MAG TPA: F0F1 ATP synthase subunit epsilon [Chloroflexota bacterium]|nr:F0F1 ATP synthase subunit epsilon [Chloroflexota bacterium]
MPLRVEVVTVERLVLSDTADMVIAPGAAGVVGILPRHAPMIASLNPGELRLKKGTEEVALAVTGGILQVEPDKVIVLADAAERAEEVDQARAQQAVERARASLAELRDAEGQAAAQAALARALARLRVAEGHRHARHTPAQND